MKSVLFIFSIASLLFLASCQTRSTSSLPESEVAFIEYYTTVDGLSLEGTPPPGMRIDGPTYTFNDQASGLHSFVNPGFDPLQPIAILGMGRILRGTEGGGLSSRLMAISQLPHKEGEFSLKSIAKGRIKFELLGKSYTLEAGKEALALYWLVDTIDYGTERAIIRKTISHQVLYHGSIKRSAISFPEE